MSNQFEIDIEGLEPAIRRFENAPKMLAREMKKPMTDSMNVVHEKVPGYPPQRANQKTPYKRTGTLARSLGITQGGGQQGKPTVYSIKGSGGNMVGQFGTNLTYAKYVIGSPDAPKGKGQAWMHKGWWWTLDFVSRRAKEKVQAVWNEWVSAILSR